MTPAPKKKVDPPDPDWLNRRLSGQIVKAEPDQKDKRKFIKLSIALRIKEREMMTAFPDYVLEGLEMASHAKTMMAPTQIKVRSPALAVSMEIKGFARNGTSLKVEKADLKPGLTFRSRGVEIVEQDALITLEIPYKDSWIKFLADHLKGPLVHITLRSKGRNQRSIPGTGHKAPRRKPLKRRVTRASALKRVRSTPRKKKR